MMRNERSRALPTFGLSLIAIVAMFNACNCDKDVVNPITYSCEVAGGRPGPDNTTPCGPSKRFVKGRCEEIRCDAGESPAGCCPGQFCSGGGACEVPVRWVQYCLSSAECDDGQVCANWPLLDGDPDLMTCRFPPIDEGGVCSNGGVPFNGRCVLKAPCGGSCAPGQVCNIDVTRIVADLPQGGDCETPPALGNAGNGCDQTCDAAEILVYTEPDQMLFDQCCEVTCECLTLPPLVPGRWGRYSDIAVGPSNLFVSAYDAGFGDLVLGVHGKLSGQLEELDYVDGVPSGGAVVADPAGPRGGRDGPGPDVGTYTSVALFNGLPRIVYYDVENQNLKYARYDGSLDAWTTALIDDGRDATGIDTGDVGRFTSLTIDATGIPHVSYYAHRTVVGGGLVTSPMYARGLRESPVVYEDFERVAIEPFASCNEQCTDTQECVVEGGGSSCQDTRTDCAAACPCDQACVDISGQPQCRPWRPNTLREPCDGECPDGFLCVADAPTGTICRQDRAGNCGDPTTCSSDEICVDDGAGTPVCRVATPPSRIAGLPEGVGLFSSLELFNSRPAVVYYDRLQGQLRGAVADFDFDQPATTFSAGVLACDPLEDLGQHASLAVSPDGLTVAVAFQGAGGETLVYKEGADLLVDLASASFEWVDDGTRGTQVSLVGGFASLAFDEVTGDPFVAYADQTENDLLLSYRRGTTWSRLTLLDDGAFGSFSSLAIEGGRAYVSTYLRARDELDRDISELLIHVVDLSALP